MPIRQLTPAQEIEKYTDEQLARLHQVVIRNLLYVGEAVLNAARSTNSYKDQTGNLRSSIGYVLSVDGEIVKQSSFDLVKEGAEGQKQGASFAETVARRYPQSICLIVVAGMNYAVHVSNKGYDVLDSSELLAERLVPAMLEQLGFR